VSRLRGRAFPLSKSGRLRFGAIRALWIGISSPGDSAPGTLSALLRSVSNP
jgi:hypothetical protein